MEARKHSSLTARDFRSTKPPYQSELLEREIAEIEVEGTLLSVHFGLDGDLLPAFQIVGDAFGRSETGKNVTAESVRNSLI